MAGRQVVGLPSRQDPSAAGGALHCTCANPRCDEQFFQNAGPGRRREFCSDECRRTAERDLRRILTQVEHHDRQAEQLRARARAYTRTTVEDSAGRGAGPSEEQVQVAREAIAEVRGMARFLRGHQGEFASELLRLFAAVEPVIGGSDHG